MKDITPEGIKKEIEQGILQGTTVPYNEISLEVIEEAVINAFYGKEAPLSKMRMPSVEKCEWTKDGNIHWMWKIDSGESIMWTNDAGKEMFDEAMKKEGEKFLEK